MYQAGKKYLVNALIFGQFKSTVKFRTIRSRFPNKLDKCHCCDKSFELDEYEAVEVRNG